MSRSCIRIRSSSCLHWTPNASCLRQHKISQFGDCFGVTARLQSPVGPRKERRCGQQSRNVIPRHVLGYSCRGCVASSPLENFLGASTALTILVNSLMLLGLSLKQRKASRASLSEQQRIICSSSKASSRSCSSSDVVRRNASQRVSPSFVGYIQSASCFWQPEHDGLRGCQKLSKCALCDRRRIFYREPLHCATH